MTSKIRGQAGVPTTLSTCLQNTHGSNPFRNTDYFDEGSSWILSVLGNRGCTTAEAVCRWPPNTEIPDQSRTSLSNSCGRKRGSETTFHSSTIKAPISGTERSGMLY